MAYTPHWFITSLAAHAVATYFYFLHANACDFRFCMFYMADVKFFFHDLIILLFKLLFTFINSLAQFFHWSNKGGGAIGFLSIPTWSAFGNLFLSIFNSTFRLVRVSIPFALYFAGWQKLRKYWNIFESVWNKDIEMRLFFMVRHK